MKHPPMTECLTCSYVCALARVCAECTCVHGSTHPAVQGSGHLPQCSMLGRLPSAGVLSCSVSQHRHAPTRTLNCVTFEQTHVTCRGAGQMSTGNSTMRTYILILAPESTQTHTLSHSHTQTQAFLYREESVCSPPSVFSFLSTRKPPRAHG